MDWLFVHNLPLGLKIHQMDVKSAFLHAPIQEEIYIAQPEGYVNQKYTLGCRGM
jgi:hypothetical protein